MDDLLALARRCDEAQHLGTMFAEHFTKKAAVTALNGTAANWLADNRSLAELAAALRARHAQREKSDATDR